MIRRFLLFYAASVVLLLVAYVLATESWFRPEPMTSFKYYILVSPSEITTLSQRLFGTEPYTYESYTKIDQSEQETLLIAAGLPYAKGARLYLPLVSEAFFEMEKTEMVIVFNMYNTVANHREFHAQLIDALDETAASEDVFVTALPYSPPSTTLNWNRSLGHRNHGVRERREWTFTPDDGLQPQYSTRLTLARLKYHPSDPLAPEFPPWTPRGLEWNWEGRAWPLAFPLALLLAIPMYLLRGPLTRALLRRPFSSSPSQA